MNKSQQAWSKWSEACAFSASLWLLPTGPARQTMFLFSIAAIPSLISDFILQNCGISIGIPRPASQRDYNSESGNCHVCTLLPDRVHRFCTDSHRRLEPQHGPPDRATVRLSVAGLHHFLLWWAAISSEAGNVTEICWSEWNFVW